jgi:hypothetical protein
MEAIAKVDTFGNPDEGAQGCKLIRGKQASEAMAI